MRIAVGGIHTECSTSSPVLMQAEDFRELRGAELTESDYFAFLRHHPVEIAPLFHARAVPGGPVSRAVYEAFRAGFLAAMAASISERRERVALGRGGDNVVERLDARHRPVTRVLAREVLDELQAESG